ncbi:D-amino-acid oxidase [Infundibulicybe gibba]|nr:D-amino-acid oxidase [Infundibulicybe gibba]
MSLATEFKQIIVIGAGVVGLTTALMIQEKGGFHVTIIAEVHPGDAKTIKYTSHWAGAHHVTLAGDDMRQLDFDRATFDVMWAMSAPGSPAEGCFMRIPQTEYYSVGNENRGLEVMPNYRPLAENELLPETKSGVTFNTITIDTPVYLNYLLSRFLASGGSIIRGSVQHLSQVAEGGTRLFSGGRASSPDAIVVCAGLGARTLGGVEDKDMYPIRGQTLLVRAPWVKFGRTVSTADGLWTYIIPRRSGDIIVGGTKIDDDWYPNPRPEITKDILARGFALCPELAPPEVRARRTPTVDDVIPNIIEEGCGLRPARKGGIRLEIGSIEPANSKMKVPVVYNYGHAGSGYQSSWGSASIALQLLEDALTQNRGAKSLL